MGGDEVVVVVVVCSIEDTVVNFSPPSPVKLEIVSNIYGIWQFDPLNDHSPETASHLAKKPVFVVCQSE